MADNPRLRAGDRERDAVLEVLHQAHGAGRLDLAEVDERISQVMAAKFVDELAPVVADLPEGRSLALGSASSTAMVPAVRPANPPAVVADSPQLWSVAIMSGRDLVPLAGTQRLKGFAWWGGDNIDLTHCLGPGVTLEVDLVAIMAGSTITVPPGVHVVDSTVNIMAGNTIEPDARGDGSQGTVILRGFSWWAGNTVKLGQPPREG